MPYDAVPSDKSWQEEGRRGECSDLGRLTSHITVMRDEALLCWKRLNSCLLMERSE